MTNTPRRIAANLHCRLCAVLAALALACVALPAIAQEAPDALVKRVSQEALQIIKTDPKVQAGDQARIREADRNETRSPFRLRPDDGARRRPRVSDARRRNRGSASAKSSRRC